MRPPTAPEPMMTQRTAGSLARRVGAAGRDGSVRLRAPGGVREAPREHGPVAGGGALVFGLAAPEAVFAVPACPLPAGEQHRTGRAQRPGRRLASGASAGSLPVRREEEVPAA